MIGYNTDVEYTCHPGYTNTACDLIRTCLDDGSLTGSPLVCTSKLIHGGYLLCLIFFFIHYVYIKELINIINQTVLVCFHVICSKAGYTVSVGLVKCQYFGFCVIKFILQS